MESKGSEPKVVLATIINPKTVGGEKTITFLFLRHLGITYTGDCYISHPICFQVHQMIDKTQRKRLCRILDCNKLSVEASKQACCTESAASIESNGVNSLRGASTSCDSYNTTTNTISLLPRTKQQF